MKKRAKKGFTLIELMLSVAFLASLTVMIAVLVSNAAATYRRGITLKRVNATGTEIMEDFRATISDNRSNDPNITCDSVYEEIQDRDACKNDDGFSFVSLKGYKTVKIKGEKTYNVGEDGTPVYGLFCTGKYTYIWNSGYFFDTKLYQVGPEGHPASPIVVRYKDTDITNFRLLKVLDERRSVCIDAIARYTQEEYGTVSYMGSNDMEGIPDFYNLSSLGQAPVELISGEDGEGLALYDLTVSRPATGGSNKISFYSGSFILGSIEGGVNISSPSDYCKAFIDEGIADQDYCAVNRFNFAVQTSGI